MLHITTERGRFFFPSKSEHLPSMDENRLLEPVLLQLFPLLLFPAVIDRDGLDRLTLPDGQLLLEYVSIGLRHGYSVRLAGFAVQAMFNLHGDAYSDGSRHSASSIPRIILVPAVNESDVHDVLEHGEHALKDGNHFHSHKLVERRGILERLDIE